MVEAMSDYPKSLIATVKALEEVEGNEDSNASAYEALARTQQLLQTHYSGLITMVNIVDHSLTCRTYTACLKFYQVEGSDVCLEDDLSRVTARLVHKAGQRLLDKVKPGLYDVETQSASGIRPQFKYRLLPIHGENLFKAYGYHSVMDRKGDLYSSTPEEEEEEQSRLDLMR